MKNYTRIKNPVSARTPYELLDANGNPFVPFNKTIRKMVTNNYSANSIKSYSDHIARFLDYMFEAAQLIESHSAEAIFDAVYSYKSYLLFGKNSSDPLASSIAVTLNKVSSTSRKSLGLIDAAIKYFLLVSEAQSHTVDHDSIFGELTFREKRKLNTFEQQSLLANSMLAGVIRGGSVFTKKGGSLFGLNNKRGRSEYAKLPIPFEKIQPLLNSFKSQRDMAYYSLLAASGCRGHEARQIRWEDVDVINRKVFLRSPEKHKIEDLSEEEFRLLSWKGRAIEETFLIEPYKSMFFDSLLEYRKHERLGVTGNSYVFLQKNGRPFFTVSQSAMSQMFSKALDKFELNDPEYSTHSLRHSYGYYVVNYLPLPNGNFGLPLPLVKILMAHSSLSSTEIYAKRDTVILQASVEYANRLVFGMDNEISLNQMRIKYMQSEIDNLMELEAKVSADDKLNK